MYLPPSLDEMHPRFLQKFVEVYSTGPSRAFLRSYEADLLSQLPLELPILDLACGDGYVSALTFGRVLDSGCDLMMSQLRKAKEQGQYKTLVLADARELPYKDSTFATVISNSSIEHIPSVKKVCKEVFRVLKPEGLFVFTVPGPRFNEWFWKNWIWSRLGMPALGYRSVESFNNIRQHHNVYDIGQWNQLLESSGFSIVWNREYFPFGATFVFSFLESMWNHTIVIPRVARNRLTGKRVNLAGGLLLLLPERLRIFLQTRFLTSFSRQQSFEQGSHLLVVTRK